MQTCDFQGTTTTTTITPTNDGFQKFAKDVDLAFAMHRGPLFTTDADLFSAYIEGIAPEYRHYYECNCCKKFLNNFGGLVTINDKGVHSSVLWNVKAPAMFRRSVQLMIEAVKSAKITGVHASPDSEWGTMWSGGWDHFYVYNNKRHTARIETASQYSSRKKEEYGMVTRAMSKYDYKTVDMAFSLLDSNYLDRSEKVAGPITWFRDLLNSLKNKRTARRPGIIWSAVATAPEGFTHITSGMSGFLMDLIAAQTPITTIERKFNEKMRGDTYQRATTSAKNGAINRAEDIFAKLDMSDSLGRRYARTSELDSIWRSRVSHDTSGTFGHLRSHSSPSCNTSGQKSITWEKFQRDVLPTAEKIEYNAPDSRRPYRVFLTAENRDAPCLFQWGNHVSSYVWVGGSVPSSMNLTPGWNNVTSIVLAPHMWAGDKATSNRAPSVTFLLEGAQESRMSGTAIFPETLIGELHEVRNVIENHSKKGVLGNKRGEHAIGISISNTSGDSVFRVTRGGVTVKYKIDRWD